MRYLKHLIDVFEKLFVSQHLIFLLDILVRVRVPVYGNVINSKYIGTGTGSF